MLTKNLDDAVYALKSLRPKCYVIIITWFTKVQF
eukprot:UN07039